MLGVFERFLGVIINPNNYIQTKTYKIFIFHYFSSFFSSGGGMAMCSYNVAISPPDEKKKKTNSFDYMLGVFWEGVRGYLEVFLGGFFESIRRCV